MNATRRGRALRFALAAAAPLALFACDSLLGLHDPVDAPPDGGGDANLEREASRCAPGLSPCGTRCVDLSGSAAECGACGHSCLGGTCSDGVCSAVAATAVPHAYWVAADDAGVYVGTIEYQPVLSSAVVGFPVEGPFDAGAILYDGAAAVVDLADDGARVLAGFYPNAFVPAGETPPPIGELLALRDGGSTPVATQLGVPIQITFAADGIYFLELVSGQTYRVDGKGGAAVAVDQPAPVAALAPASDGGVFFASPEAGVGRAAAGESAVVLAPGSASTIASDGRAVYFGGPAVLALAADGGAPDEVAPASTDVRDLAVDARWIYVVTNTSLVAFPRDGGASVHVSDDPPAVDISNGHRIAIGPRAVYWIDGAGVLRYWAR